MESGTTLHSLTDGKACGNKGTRERGDWKREKEKENDQNLMYH